MKWGGWLGPTLTLDTSPCFGGVSGSSADWVVSRTCAQKPASCTEAGRPTFSQGGVFLATGATLLTCAVPCLGHCRHSASRSTRRRHVRDTRLRTRCLQTIPVAYARSCGQGAQHTLVLPMLVRVRPLKAGASGMYLAPALAVVYRGSARGQNTQTGGDLQSTLMRTPVGLDHCLLLGVSASARAVSMRLAGSWGDAVGQVGSDERQLLDIPRPRMPGCDGPQRHRHSRPCRIDPPSARHQRVPHLQVRPRRLR